MLYAFHKYFFAIKGYGHEKKSAESEHPVQEIAGFADEDAESVPAVLHPVHQAERVQEAYGQLLKFRLSIVD